MPPSISGIRDASEAGAVPTLRNQKQSRHSGLGFERPGWGEANVECKGSIDDEQGGAKRPSEAFFLTLV